MVTWSVREPAVRSRALSECNTVVSTSVWDVLGICLYLKFALYPAVLDSTWGTVFGESHYRLKIKLPLKADDLAAITVFP